MYDFNLILPLLNKLVDTSIIVSYHYNNYYSLKLANIHALHWSPLNLNLPCHVVMYARMPLLIIMIVIDFSLSE